MLSTPDTMYLEVACSFSGHPDQNNHTGTILTATLVGQ